MAEEQMTIPEGGLNVQDAAAMLLQRVESAGENQDAEKEPEEVQSSIEGEAEVEQEETFDDADVIEGDEAEAYEEDTGERFTVKVDGEEIEVGLDELVNGYSRQSSYTKKSQALSQERKEFEEQRDAVLQERSVYADMLSKLQNRLLSEDTVPEPDWDALFDENPIQATRQKYEWDKAQQSRQGQLQKISDEQERLTRELQVEQDRAMRDIVTEQTAEVRKLIPEWDDDKGFKEGAQTLRNWLIEYGLDEADVNSMVMAKHVELAEMARRYALGMSRSKERPAKQKTVRAGVSQRRGKARPKAKAAQAQSQRLQKSGRLQDAVDLAKLLEL
tara:strand:- start:9264 stop:10256 length:993 start_codon:yes stop_codon:yes gene_type:complete